MVELQLFNNISDTNVVDKIINNQTIVNGDFRGAVNIQYPSLGIIGEYYDFNYCYIPLLHRYYYIESVTMERKNLTLIKCRVDVLMTYKDDIRNSYGLLSKSTNFNPYYDGGYKHENRDNFRQIDFESPFDRKGSIILITSTIKAR